MLFEPKFDKTYITSQAAEPENCHLACGFITRTDILFKEENIAAVIERTGEIQFGKADDMRTTLASVTVPKQEGGREIYMDVTYSVENGQIVLKMPIYRWIDRYPHCDGESDRWDTETIGYHTVRYDLETQEITMEEWNPAK